MMTEDRIREIVREEIQSLQAASNILSEADNIAYKALIQHSLDELMDEQGLPDDAKESMRKFMAVLTGDE